MEDTFKQVLDAFVKSTPFLILAVDDNLSFKKSELFDPNDSQGIFMEEGGDVPTAEDKLCGTMKIKDYPMRLSPTFNVNEFVQGMMCDVAHLLEEEAISVKGEIHPFIDSALDTVLGFEEPRIMAPTWWFGKYGSKNGSVKQKIALENDREKLFMKTRYPEYNAPLVCIPGKAQTHLIIFSQLNSLVVSTPKIQEIDSKRFQLSLGYGIQHINQLEIYCLPKLPKA